MTACANCAAENPAGQKFCGHCGAPLAAVCSSCGSANPPGQKFCGECGAALPTLSAGRPEPHVVPAEPLLTERRLVSVLFVDLVGFTTLSESRDPEDVRELLSRYFESARRLIELYGGVVEKFIGDAVMAVWGTPVAQEDDAERAVRAALDLVAAVDVLAEGDGTPSLRARAGVLTGEAVANLAAVGEGMVAGDLVNTAARIQAAAEPGSVLVGETTRRATERAVAFAEVGEHVLKGKDKPVVLYRALRVTAARGGALRSEGLEPPFVGRERELRLVKELFHGSADGQRAQLALVTGIAGIGKSRLAWEFEKYIDGLATEAFWHRGRCLSYGEGVAYRALAEMVRMRCRIVEDEQSESARTKLRLALEEYILDPDERAWVEPRLAHLLGLEQGAPGDQENLFSAWRILFERLAEQSATILVFEDLHWADAGLLDFVEYLLDWSRGHPLFVLALARPELADKRPSWGAGKRSFASLHLEPLSAAAMGDLLAGLVPGLPDDLGERILDRAQGVPLYAVETVRMLLDRGVLTRDGDVYRATGAVESLEVPETLHALVAARLDSLASAERRLVECGAVLGKTFTKQALSSVAQVPEAELDPLLATLLAKEILSVQADPRSPERGQYTFLQDIVKRVAYDTVTRRERKNKHLAAARFLASVGGAEEDELVEIAASHYLDAYQAAPDDPDASELRSKAFELLVRAGERAASLGASAEAQRTFQRAAALTDNTLAQAELYERAGMMASIGARQDDAAANLERARELFDAAGATHPAARVSARIAEIMWDRGRLEEGLETMERAFAVLSEEEPDADTAAVAAQIARFMWISGQTDAALERVERALDIAERLVVPETLAQALITKGIVLLAGRGRRVEGSALLRKALDLALDHDKPSTALRAYFNLANAALEIDRAHEAADLAHDGLELARRVGNRYWEWAFLAKARSFYLTGDWDEVVAREQALPEGWVQVRTLLGALLLSIVPVRIHRGQLEEARRTIRLLAEGEQSADMQERGLVHFAEAALLWAEGRHAEALRCAEASLATRATVGFGSGTVREAFVIAVDAALALGDLSRAQELLALVDALPPGSSSPFLRAHSYRFHARLAALEGAVDEAHRLFTRSAGVFRELGFAFYLAVTLLEHGEWLVGQGRREEAEPLLAEAGATFERLGAKPWLDRLDGVVRGMPTEVSR